MKRKQQLATICYLDDGENFLMLHRNKKPNDVHQGKWIGVGGKLEAGESPEEGARREILEETGLAVEKLQMIGTITFPEFTPDTDWYTFVFRVREFTGVLGPCDEGTLEWVPYDQVLSKPTWEGDLQFLSWILEEAPFFSAKMSYKDFALIDSQVVFYQ